MSGQVKASAPVYVTESENNKPKELNLCVKDSDCALNYQSSAPRACLILFVL